MTLLTRPSEEVLKGALAGKVAIITGAAQGIGFAVAHLLATHGAQVVVADIAGESVKRAAERIGHGAYPATCDVASWESQLDLFARTIQEFKKIDIVVCNAGIDPEIVFARARDDPIRQRAVDLVKFNFLADEMDDDGQLRRLKPPPQAIIDVNFFGVVYGVKLAVHHMIKCGRGGSIIVMGSAASYVGVPSQMIYSASKHAVLGLLRSTSQSAELQDNGIRISMVSPWLTNTTMTSDIAESSRSGALASSPEDVAWAVGVLVSSERETANGKSIWVQGQTLTEVEDKLAACYKQLMI